MSIHERAGSWYYRFKVNGKTYRGTTGLAATRQNENVAKVIEANKRVAVAEGREPTDVEGVPFPTAADEFLDWCKFTQYSAKPNSAARIATSFSSLKVYFGDQVVSAIKAIDVERYKTWRKSQQIKDVTLRNDLNALSLFFKYSIIAKWRERGSNPLLGEDKVKRPSGEDAVRMHILSAEEEDAYFSHAKGTLRDVAKLILLQGARPDEVMSLKKSHYLRERRELQIAGGKTRAARRYLHLMGESIEIIERRMKLPGEWLFPSSRVEGYHVTQLHTSHDSVCQDAEVSFVLYDLRHTFATRLAVDQKCDLPSLAAILGHAGLRAVMKYLHPTADHQKSAMQRYESSRPKAKLRQVN